MPERYDQTRAHVVHPSPDVAGGCRSEFIPTDRSGKTLSSDQTGRGAVVYTTDTTPVTGSFDLLMCLTDTVFSAFTRTDSTGSIVGVTIPAGTLLAGPVTAYTLTSGVVAAYS